MLISHLAQFVSHMKTTNVQFNLTFLCFKAESITNDSTIFFYYGFSILLSAKCSLWKHCESLNLLWLQVHNTNLSAFRFGLLGAVDASRLHSHSHRCMIVLLNTFCFMDLEIMVKDLAWFIFEWV